MATYDSNEQYGRRPRRRRWRYVILLLLVATLGVGWTVLWRYAAATAEETITGWRAREAKLGRFYDCGSQTIGGFPFRIEVTCQRASAELRSHVPPFEVKTTKVLVAAQIYEPTLLISEFDGPLTIAEPGRTPAFVANWKLAQTSVRGHPREPERVSIVLDGPKIERVNAAGNDIMVAAHRIELHGRMVAGSAADDPVIEIALRLAHASMPVVNDLAVPPIDADVTGVLHGLKDFSPKPWRERFREIQAAGGRIDITHARVAQRETIAVGRGSLSINARGRLDGTLHVTIVGIEPFLNAMGVDRIAQATPAVDKIANALDKLMPGLGTAAREKAGANISAGMNFIGQRTILEGKQAVSLPLRFADDVMYLGPIPLGPSPAVF